MGRFSFVAGMALGGWLGTRAARRRRRSRGPDASEFDFLSLMAHELKTPINIVGGYLELLEGEIPDPLPASAREYVHQARLATLRLAELVQNLLSWARLETGRQHVHIDTVHADDIVRDACHAKHEQAEARGIRLEIESSPGLVLRTDRVKACRALSALVANAIKFTAEGAVRVSVRSVGRRVRFLVHDTGIGIPPEHLDDVFRPYWQLEATVRRTRGGVGIGLALARRLARLLGGDVTVRSVPAVGSEFVLDLPGE